MTKDVLCQSPPGPHEGYAARFDDLSGVLEQRRKFREYLVPRHITLSMLSAAFLAVTLLAVTLLAVTLATPPVKRNY